ncbi:5-methylcytosine rRNA methyltransferase NSUN4 [Blattella germanica]|nr:5-methylcytosine rRNA methyltransferase NSUN4 [Blattella germanica]
MYKSGKCIIRSCKLVEISVPITIPRRWKKKKEHWSVLAKKQYPVDKALEHFDDFYKTVYGTRWPSIRLALLSPHKYCAVVNNFATTESTVSQLEEIGALNLKTVFKLEKERILQEKQEEKRKHNLETIFELDRKLDKIVFDKQQEERLSLYAQKGDHERPPVGKVFSFEQGNISRFPSPKRDITGVLNYYLLDGGSLLPVLALDLRPGDRILDMCAAPGGKSLIMLQTLFPDLIVCNDVSLSRTNRIRDVLKQYLYDLDEWKNRLIITQKDGRVIDDFNVYNKILVDVPCTTDRHSLHENDNNIFAPGRTKERLQIPEIQSELLFQALKIVRPGGTVIYSTCSLSPIQNDGVVHMALRKIWEESKVEIVVKDMTTSLQVVQNIFKFGENLGLKYGHLVLPFLPCNFGPMYFCKLVRTK